MGMKPFTTTGGERVWIDDRHVVKVYGEADSVKIVTVHRTDGPFKGTPEDAAKLLNSRRHLIVEVAQ